MRAITVFLAIALLLPLGVAGQTLTTTNARSLSLEQCIAMALEKNLGIKIARQDVRASAALLYRMYTPYDPELNISASYSSTTEEQTRTTGIETLPGERTQHGLQTGIGGWLPTGMRYDIGADLFYRTIEVLGTNQVMTLSDYRTDTGIRVAQPLLRDLWIDDFRYLIKRRRHELHMSEHAFLLTVMQTVRDVHLNYYELIFARENVLVQEKALELAQRQASENKKRVEVGTMAPLDEKQAEAAAATARAGLITALQQLGTQENLLINVVSDNYEEWQGVRVVPTENLVAVPQSYNLPGSWVAALTHRPDLNQKKAELERWGIEVRFRHNEMFPQLDLVGSYGRQGFDRGFSGSLADIRDDRLPRYSFGIVLTMPFENRYGRGVFRESKAIRERVQYELKQLHQNILIQVEDAVGNAQGTFQRVAATREARLAAEAAYDAEVKKLENGKSTSFQVLSLQNDLTTARSEEIRALADYNRALTELHFNEGTILQRRRITVEP